MANKLTDKQLKEALDKGRSLQNKFDDKSKSKGQSGKVKGMINSSDQEVPFQENVSLPKWVCRVDGNPQDGQWTVGEVFHLECEGGSVEFSSTDIEFQLPEEQQHGLKVLGVEKQTGNSLLLKATTYKTGNTSYDKIVITDGGAAKVVMEPLQLSVKSIIKDPQQKAYGPASALKMSYPMWIFVVLCFAVLGFAFWGLFKFRRKSQMRKVIEELKQHNTSLGPFNQFNKDLRTLRRKNIFTDQWPSEKKQRYVESLDEIFRMYLLREFYIPALDWNSKLVVKEISKNDKKRFSSYGNNLMKLLKELDRARSDIEKVKVHGCQQLTQMAVKVSQEVWQQRKN